MLVLIGVAVSLFVADCQFRCCSSAAAISLSSIADAADAPALAADYSAAVVAFIRPFSNSEHENYDESIVDPDHSTAAGAAVSDAKRLGVPPLLRTESATLCLWDWP